MKFKKFKFKKVKSTNNTAIRIIKESKYSLGMIVAETQINGRGQYGRKWISLKGNLFMSIFYNLNKVNIPLNDLTKINRDIIKKTISSFYKKKITFKFPNDLLINNQKICGILQEIVNKKNQKFLILGVGMNIIKSPYISNYPTTNLYEITGKKLSYKLVANLLKSKFEKKFSKFF